MSNRLCIIVPTFQAASSIPILVARIRKVASDLPIIIVDDGSTDATPRVCQGMEVIYIRHTSNRGKDKALQTGIMTARLQGCTHAILMDADLQHPPESIPQFRGVFDRFQPQLILGRRSFRLGSMPIHRILSNTITSLMISIRSGRRVHDSQCGFRLIALNLLDDLPIRSRGFQYESEVLLRLLMKKVMYHEVEIPTVYNESPSSINNVLDTLRFIRFWLGSFLW